MGVRGYALAPYGSRPRGRLSEHDRLPSQYVPQLMVEMLVTGAEQATYLSASAAQGINLIRVPRDDEYIAELLHYLREFWTTVRRDDGAPPDDLYWRGDESGRYRRFLQRTRQIGERSSVLRHVARPWRREASGTGGRFFV